MKNQLNVMVNNGMVEVVRTLENGVNVIENNLVNDFELTQSILNEARATRNFDARAIYNEREYLFFENSYSVKVQRENDYQAFKKLLEAEKCFNLQSESIRSEYNNDEISFNEYVRKMDSLRDCECQKCTLVDDMNFTAWQSNSVEVEEYNKFTDSMRKRAYKLGKYMKKVGFTQSLIDFYSTQIKDERQVYLTITSKAQYIAGMSYFAKLGTWNGYSGSSCQDVRHDMAYCKHLGGALADDKLYIAFLHYDMNDLNDMKDKMVARVLMRPIEVEGEICLIPIKYYGNNATTSQLHYALNQLNELLIYSNDITKYNSVDSFSWYTEYVSEGVEQTVTRQGDAYVSEYVTMTCECPMCNGGGEIVVDIDDVEHNTECPLCDGSGEYEQEVQVHFDEYIEVEIEEQLYAYADDENYFDFDEYNESYTFRVNETKIKTDIKKFVEKDNK